MVNISYESGELDYFFRQSREYRKTAYFRRLVEFSMRMVHLKPFNAMLVHNQLPGARYMLYPETWYNRYHRILKPNAQPLVILNFKPVGYLFDLADTVIDPNYADESDRAIYSDDEKLLIAIENQFKAEFTHKTVEMEVLYRNLNINGVAVDDQMAAGAAMAAKIQVLNNPIPVTFNVTKKKEVSHPLPFLISIRKDASDAEKVASISHELGHLFCHHLPCPFQWKVRSRENSNAAPAWVWRYLPKSVEEIEAESVAHLVCSRLGIKTKSMEYIAEYIGNSDEIPEEVEYNVIFSAANKVLDFFQRMRYQEGLLFKHDYIFRDKMKY